MKEETTSVKNLCRSRTVKNQWTIHHLLIKGRCKANRCTYRTSGHLRTALLSRLVTSSTSRSQKLQLIDMSYWYHGHPQVWARAALAIPWKMYKDRFASITTFWFSQKEPKLWSQTRFACSKYPNCDCGRGSAPDPTGGVYSAPQTRGCI